MTTSLLEPSDLDVDHRLKEEELLTFVCDEQEYGVDILRVQEIRGWDNVTRVPGVPHYVRGVLNLRGTIVPIIDLRRRFGLDPVDYGDTTVIVVLQVKEEDRVRVMGIVVDAVSDVCRMKSDEVQETPDMGASAATDHIRGMITRDENLIIILDIDRLLNSPELGGRGEVRDDEGRPS